MTAGIRTDADHGPPLIDLRERLAGRNRLFFAIYPEAEAARRAYALGEDLRRTHGLRGKVRGVDRLHVTLLFLNDFEDEAADVVAAAGEVAASLKAEPFEVEFDCVMSFPRKSNRPLVLRGGGALGPLEAFQRRLEEALCSRFVLAPGSYAPHLTLLYDDRKVSRRPIEPISWTVREFALVRSLLGQSRHVTVARWPLQTGG
jgi:2'-5' RNA ligase